MSIYFEDIAVGQTYVSSRRTITETDVVSFAGLSADFGPLQAGESQAADSAPGLSVAHQMLGPVIGSGLRTEMDTWHALAFLGCRRTFELPLRVGDTVHVEYRVTDVRLSTSNRTHGVVTVETKLVDDRGTVLQRGEDVTLVAARRGVHGN